MLGNRKLVADASCASELPDPQRPYKHNPLVGYEQRFILFDNFNTANDEIHATILHRDLTEFDLAKNGFIAASYVWGPPSKDCRIIIDGGEFLQITENCFDMLQKLRNLTKGRPLWVDAISINQMDIEEKSRVVSQMAKIYESAAEVFVYIGDEIEGTAGAFDLLKNPQSALEEVMKIPAHQHPNTPDGRIGQAVHELFEREWFYRSWILQEAIKGDERCMIVCGSILHKWTHLVPVVFIFWPRRTTPPCVHVAIFDNNENRAMNRLLPLIRYCDATDPRDKIFSLLGIASDAETIPSPDYRKSKEQVYTEIAKWWISTYGNLELLASADGPGPEAKTDVNMASWVPDWSRRPAREILGVFEKNSFRAGGSKALHEPFSAGQMSGTKPVLRAGGMLIGTADKIINNCKRYADLIPVVREYASYGSPEGNEKALSTTLRFGAVREGRPSLAGDRIAFDAYSLWKTTHGEEEWPVYDQRHGRRILDHEYLPCNDHRSEDVKYETIFKSRRYGRVLAITGNGFLCFAPDSMKPGDVIYVLYGSTMPVALRKVDDHYIVLGQCYVDGIMYGEVLPEKYLCGEDRGLKADSTLPPLPFKFKVPNIAGEEEVIEIW